MAAVPLRAVTRPAKSRNPKAVLQVVCPFQTFQFLFEFLKYARLSALHVF